MSTPFDFAGLAAVTDHRDADLLDLIEQFSQLNDTAWRLIRRADGIEEGSPAYKRLWREALSSHHERGRLEQAICAIKAQTTLGVVAKANLWLELHSDNSGTMMDLPRAAITELLAMLVGA